MSDSAPSRSGQPPTTAVAFGLTGASLIAFEAVVYLVYANSSGAVIGWIGLDVARSLGATGLATAIALASVTGAIYVIPRSHAAIGILMITFSLLSLFAGGGYILGALLGWVGGAFAVGYRPEGWLKGAGQLARSSVGDDPVMEADLADAGIPTAVSRDDGDAKAPTVESS